jgi:serine/threonine protein kinase
MIGNVIGNYKITEKIGEGGMGAVYKGVDLMLEREVAIKVLKPELANQPQVVERFRSEAVTLAKLNHPNIATLFNFVRQADSFFMVLEFVKGTPLDNIIENHGSIACEHAIPLFCQMLEGIEHAHGFGIIHRDIKPANMMLTDKGVLKVLDFGIARALGSARMTRAGHLIGTIEYMAPEQVRGFETDARSDIYSLGMVLYEMLTGRVPFQSDSEFELMKAQVEQLPTPPRQFSPHIPEQVEWAILCATEKDPDKRFQTAAAFCDAIEDCVKTAIASGTLSEINLRRPGNTLSTLPSGQLWNQSHSSQSTGGIVVSREANVAGNVEPPTRPEQYPPPTRYAEPESTHASGQYVKATRLGDPSPVQRVEHTTTSSQAPVTASQSLSKFRPIHVAIAGGVLAIFFGLIGVGGLVVYKVRKGRVEITNQPQVQSPVERPTPAAPIQPSEPSPFTHGESRPSEFKERPPSESQAVSEPAAPSVETEASAKRARPRPTTKKPRTTAKGIMDN